MFRAIYYASKTFNEAQENYSTTEKETLAIVFSCEKFRPYILGSHIIIHTNHAAIKYLMAKKEAKPRLIRRVDSCHSRVIRNQQNLYPKFLLLP